MTEAPSAPQDPEPAAQAPLASAELSLRHLPPSVARTLAEESSAPARAAEISSPGRQRPEPPRGSTEPPAGLDDLGQRVRIAGSTAVDHVAPRTPSAAAFRAAQPQGGVDEPAAEIPSAAARAGLPPPQPVIDAELAAGSPTPTEPPAPRAEAWPRIVETELGGLFFLVNLALFLDLYGDFAQPRHADLGMPMFDFITLLGQELVGADDDPIWALFAELACRAPDEPPAGDFVPPVQWWVPPAWLGPFADDSGDWPITVGAGRLQILHPAGFVAVEIPRAPAAPSLARWLAWVASYGRARLSRATGCEDLSPLWRRRARVFVTGARLDIELALHDHPIEVRIAGLDRDPGWLPATGRDLRFHFR